MTDDAKTSPAAASHGHGSSAQIPSTGLTPELLAHRIYDEAIAEAGGDERDASITVMRFLTEALIYSAGVSCGGDEIQLKGVLKHLGKMIAEAPVHPIVAATAARKKDP